MWTLFWVCVFLATAALSWVCFRLLRAQRLGSPGEEEGTASVSVVLVAHDEAPRIGEAIRSALAEDHPALELLVVDDRSRDGTGEAARRAAGGDPRVRLLRIEERPPGWQGRVHAQDLGARAARGEWLFFLSADQRILRKDLLRAAIAECERRGAKAVSLLPRFVGEHWWERLWFHPIVNNPLVWGTFLAADRVSRSVWLLGAITMRRCTYEDMGGARAALACGAGAYEDFGWSRSFAERGERAEMLIAPGLEDVSNWTRFGEFFQGLTRWLAGLFTYRRGGWVAAAAFAGLIVACYVALAHLAADLAAARFPGLAELLALGFALTFGASYCRWNARPWWVAPVFLLVGLEVLVTFGATAVAALRNRAGWRDDALRIRAEPPGELASEPTSSQEGPTAPEPHGRSRAGTHQSRGRR